MIRFTTDTVRAVVLATLMFGWLFAGAVAFTGAATAQPDVDVTVEAPADVAPGEEFTVMIEGEEANTLELEGDTDGLTVEAIPQRESDLTTFPEPDDLPTELDEDQLVATSQLDEPAAMTFEITFAATVETGTYDFTAVAEAEDADGNTYETTQDFSIAVTSADAGPTVEVPETVQPNEQFTLNVSADDAFEIRVEGDTEGFTVENYQANAGDLATFPDPSGLPVTLEAGDDFLTSDITSEEPGEQEFVVDMNATVEEGTYNLTASATDDEQLTEEPFTIEVADTSVPEDNPVSDDLYRAVDDSGDGELDRDEIRGGVQQFATQGNIDGIEVTRGDIRELIQFFATQ